MRQEPAGDTLPTGPYKVFVAVAAGMCTANMVENVRDDKG